MQRERTLFDFLQLFGNCQKLLLQLSLALSLLHTLTTLLFPSIAAVEIAISTKRYQLLSNRKDKSKAKVIWHFMVPLLH